ncbi:MAG: type II secretion system F family protein [Tetrasphaera sp.]|nr:type II secretion system F family protein [Tetrasphaera sp.]
MVESVELVATISSGRVRDDLRTVAAAHRWGLTDDDVWSRVGPEWQPAATAWMAAVRAGVAPAELLARAATRMHAAHEEAMAARIQRTAVLLVLPLGGLFLPGFVATTVVPLVIHLIQRAGL